MLATEYNNNRNFVSLKNHGDKVRLLPQANKKVDPAFFPFVHFDAEFNWAEQVHHAGDISALVAVYKNIPDHLKKSVRKLISAEYKKKLFSIPFYEASLLLGSQGGRSGLQPIKKRLRELHADGCGEIEQQRALDFVTGRKPDDIVIIILKSGRLIGSMALYPFNKKEDIPSLSYLKLDPHCAELPDVSGIGIGRLARASSIGCHVETERNDLTNTVALAAAFNVAKDFALTRGLLSEPDSVICGDTYGSFLACLSRFFPVRIFESVMNPDILDCGNPVRPLAMYLIQRHVLGSFENSDDLISTIDGIGESNPTMANRIEQLLASGLKDKGISTIKRFDPERYKLRFFSFPFYHTGTLDGFKRLEKIVLRTKKRLEQSGLKAVFLDDVNSAVAA